MKKAIISVSNKEGIIEFSQELVELGFEIFSTGGTLDLLQKHNVKNVKSIKSLTQFPEILNGRVKTLNPKILGGILARRDVDTHSVDLEKIKSSMSSKEKHQLVNDSKALAERQEALPDKNLLPKLELSDVPNDTTYPKTKKLSTFGYSPIFYEQATNGLTYNSISRSLTISSADEVGDLMLLSNLFGKV